MRIEDVMDRDITSFAEETTLLDAISILAIHNTSGLPVTSPSGRVMGFLSEKDILRAVIPGYLGYMDESFSMPDSEKIKNRVKLVGQDPVRDYMTKNSIVFDESETISNAMVTLFKKDIKRAPVARDGILIGIVDREAILKGFVHDIFDIDTAEASLLVSDK
jgi:CBS domain-containing protein